MEGSPLQVEVTGEEAKIMLECGDHTGHRNIAERYCKGTRTGACCQKRRLSVLDYAHVSIPELAFEGHGPNGPV